MNSRICVLAQNVLKIGFYDKLFVFSQKMKYFRLAANSALKMGVYIILSMDDLIDLEGSYSILPCCQEFKLGFAGILKTGSNGVVY